MWMSPTQPEPKAGVLLVWRTGESGEAMSGVFILGAVLAGGVGVLGLVVALLGCEAEPYVYVCSSRMHRSV